MSTVSRKISTDSSVFRAFRKMFARLRERTGMPFSIHPHQIRHSCEYTLRESDTRSLQAYLIIGLINSLCDTRQCQQLDPKDGEKDKLSFIVYFFSYITSRIVRRSHHPNSINIAVLAGRGLMQEN
jgi:integrase